MTRPKVVIVGGGFAGLNAAKSIAELDVEITLIDRNNYHLFQPLLYQVATASLASVDIAYPIRNILKKFKNVEVLMAEVLGIDASRKVIRLDQSELVFDYLVLAPGSHYNYFGNSQWEPFAPSLKTVSDALKIRKMVLTAFERAEMESDPKKRTANLNFIIVGGGPTGVELAGSIAELAHHTLSEDFRRIDPGSAKILLIEAAPRILGPFPESLAQHAKKRLERMGVQVCEGSRVEQIDAEGVVIDGKTISAHTVLWCAGVLASPLLKSLNIELDRGGRAPVCEDLSLDQYPDIFVLGDAANFAANGAALPGLAPVATQQGRHMRKVIAARMRQEPRGPKFNYLDKGSMATVGKGYAIVQMGRLKTAGFFGWLLWIFVHILYLVGFRNRAMVLFQWAWQYYSFDRGARVIAQDEP